MDRRTYVAMSSTALLSLFPMWRARAQGQVTARRIGTLSLFARADVEVLADATRIELEKLGWTDSRKLTWLPPRTAEGKNELLPALAAELVAQGPDLILVQSVPAARALVQATKSIPIVMVAVGNPVESGIVPSLGKPGGNVDRCELPGQRIRYQGDPAPQGGGPPAADHRPVHQSNQRSGTFVCQETECGRRRFRCQTADRRGLWQGRS